MPYIKETERELIDIGFPPGNAGELNYAVTMLCWNYFNQRGGRYQQINDIVGALEGAKLEFYRRVAAPYEDKKIVENGDCYRSVEQAAAKATRRPVSAA